MFLLRIFVLRYNSIPVGLFPRRVSMVIFFTIKNHLCADEYAATVCAIKSTQSKQDKPPRCLQCKKSIRRDSSNDLTFIARKTTFRTRKRFHNKQYTHKSKDQPFESERTHFYVRLYNSNVTMHRPTIIFLLSHKITTVQ